MPENKFVIDVKTHKKPKTKFSLNFKDKKDSSTSYGTYMNDKIVGSNNQNEIEGRPGDDLIIGGPKINTICGEEGSDYIVGGPSTDILFGGVDNDTDVIIGNGGDDFIDDGTGDGNDYVYAGDGNDSMNIRGGNDYVHAGNGTDYIYAEAGNNILDGGKGNDHVESGKGDDIFISQDGDDGLITHGGSNVFYVEHSPSKKRTVKIRGFSSKDCLALNVTKEDFAKTLKSLKYKKDHYEVDLAGTKILIYTKELNRINMSLGCKSLNDLKNIRKSNKNCQLVANVAPQKSLHEGEEVYLPVLNKESSKKHYYSTKKNKLITPAVDKNFYVSARETINFPMQENNVALPHGKKQFNLANARMFKDIKLNLILRIASIMTKEQ